MTGRTIHLLRSGSNAPADFGLPGRFEASWREAVPGQSRRDSLDDVADRAVTAAETANIPASGPAHSREIFRCI
jgi:hypothetical protein